MKNIIIRTLLTLIAGVLLWLQAYLLKSMVFKPEDKMQLWTIPAVLIMLVVIQFVMFLRVKNNN